MSFNISASFYSSKYKWGPLSLELCSVFNFPCGEYSEYGAGHSLNAHPFPVKKYELTITIFFAFTWTSMPFTMFVAMDVFILLLWLEHSKGEDLNDWEAEKEYYKG